MIRSSVQNRTIACALLTAACAPGLLAQGGETAGATARGVFLGGTKLGLWADVELERDGKRSMVPENFEFKTGDKFWLHVTSNREAYIYVLNWTVTGPPEEASRGVLLAEDRRTAEGKPENINLVLPASPSRSEHVRRGVETKIPSAPGKFFEMDSTPGAEAMVIIASESPYDLSHYFDQNGKAHRAPAAFGTRCTRPLEPGVSHHGAEHGGGGASENEGD